MGVSFFVRVFVGVFVSFLQKQLQNAENLFKISNNCLIFPLLYDKIKNKKTPFSEKTGRVRICRVLRKKKKKCINISAR